MVALGGDFLEIEKIHDLCLDSMDNWISQVGLQIGEVLLILVFS